MAIFWLTFRIADKTINGDTYDERRDAVYDTIRGEATNWWIESTSFIVFESEKSTKSLAMLLKAAIAPSEDLLLIRKMDVKDAYIIGRNEDADIHKFMDYLEKL